MLSPANRSGSAGRVQRAEGLLARGDLDAAGSLADALYVADPRAPSVLDLRAAVLGRSGDLEGQARMLHELHGVDDRPGPRREERAVLGQIVETTPGWRPRIPGRPPDVPPASDDLVLHLVAESLPGVINANTLAFQAGLRAAREAGIRSVVVTGLGFPRRLGGSVGLIDDVDGIPHHRLDLGPYYPLDGPIDTFLEDAAWLTAAAARDLRPAILHVWVGSLDLEQALVGAAVRDHSWRPLVWTALAGSADPGASSIGERRRHAVERVLIEAADHVIVASESARAELVRRGLDAGQVSVLANPLDGARLREIYGAALERWARPASETA
jgi:Glycosyltransferase Family 4